MKHLLTTSWRLMGPLLPEVARRAGVASITADLAYAAPGVKTVDAAGRILDVLGPSGKTRKIVHEPPNGN